MQERMDKGEVEKQREEILSRLQLLLNLNPQTAQKVYEKLFEMIRNQIKKERGKDNNEKLSQKEIEEIHRRINQLLSNLEENNLSEEGLTNLLSSISSIESKEQKEKALAQLLTSQGLSQQEINLIFQAARQGNYDYLEKYRGQNELMNIFFFVYRIYNDPNRNLEEFVNRGYLSREQAENLDTQYILKADENTKREELANKEYSKTLIRRGVEKGNSQLISLIKKYAPEVFFETMKELTKREAFEKLLLKQEQSIQRIKKLMKEEELEIKELMERIAEVLQKGVGFFAIKKLFISF